MASQDDINIAWNAPMFWCREGEECEAIWHVSWCPKDPNYKAPTHISKWLFVVFVLVPLLLIILSF